MKIFFYNFLFQALISILFLINIQKKDRQRRKIGGITQILVNLGKKSHPKKKRFLRLISRKITFLIYKTFLKLAPQKIRYYL